MQIQHDYIDSGEWFHCRQCNSYGDLIELSSRVWQLSIEATINKLSIELQVNAPSTETIMNYIRDHIEYRKRMQEFWQKAKNNYPFDFSKVLRGLQHKFGLLDTLDHSRWATRLGRFLGASTREEVEGVFQPHVIGGPAKGNVGRHRCFVGPKWSDVFVIPMYDLPERIKGFLFIGRNGQKNDIVYRKTWIHDDINDAGIAFLSAAYSTEKVDEFGNRVFAIFDPVAALKLHSEHFQDNASVLPIVATYSNHSVLSQRFHQTLATNKLIFVGPEDNEAGLIKQAKLANGLIVDWQIQREFYKNRYDKKPIEWLRLFAKHCAPWEIQLENLLINFDDHQAEDILLKIDLKNDERQHLINCCSTKMQERLKTIFKAAGLTKSVVIRGKIVIENQYGWVSQKSNEVISDAIIRIDKIIFQPNINQPVYVGRVLYKGEEIPFMEKESKIAGSTYKWLKRFLLEKGKGILIGSKLWGAFMLDIAIKFQAPECMKAGEKLGWCEEQGRLQLPHFSILSNGKVELSYSSNWDRYAPGTTFYPPEKIEHVFLEKLSSTSITNKLCWAIGLSVISNILAPIFKQRTSGTIIATDGHEDNFWDIWIWWFSAQWGCNRWVMPGRGQHRLDMTEEIMKVEHRHNWPIFMERPKTQQPLLLNNWLRSQQAHSAIVHLKKPVAELCLLNGGWNLIECPASSFSRLHIEFFRKIIPAYFQDLAERKFKITTGHDFWTNVAIDLSGWFNEIGGEHTVIYDARQIIQVGNVDNRVGAFKTILNRFFHNGDIRFYRDGYDRDFDLSCVVWFQKDNAIFIPKKLINHLNKETNFPRLNIEPITELLKEKKVLLGESAYKSCPGWLVSESWWNTVI